MTIFDEYKTYTGEVSISPSLLWEYDLSCFDWWKSRKIVVQRIIERGWLKDFYAAFKLYGVAEKENPSRIIARRDLKNVILQKGENTITMDLNCPNAKLWNPDFPHLYVCRVELKSAKRIWDADSRTFGFRWFEPTGIGKDAQLRLNGQRVCGGWG